LNYFFYIFNKKLKYDNYHILKEIDIVFLLTLFHNMSVIYLLISISIIVAVVFFVAFIRAVKTGQYDDDYTPSVRMLFDDELVKKAPDENIPITENNLKP
jgi:cbb3-type cytochrome oxidase maturation protein